MEKNLEYWNNLASVAKSDEVAFTELYNHFFPRVYKFLMTKTADADTSDEIVSKTFLKMYEHLQDYNPERAAFSTWLYQIALNELKLFWRSAKTRGEHENDWDDNYDPAAPDFEEPEQKALAKERQIEIKKALEQLPERERKIIEMTYWLNYPPRKIAEVLDLKPNTVSVILKRAKESLKKILQQEKNF